MFDSILGRGLGAPGRPGVGAAISVGLHALVFALAVHLSQPLGSPLPLPPIRWPTVHMGPSAPAGPRAPASRAHPLAALKPRPPTAMPAGPQAREVGPPSDADPGPLAGSDVQDTRPSEGSCRLPPCSVDGTGDKSPVLLLGPEMVRPRLLSGPEPRYTAEAALEHVGGTVLVQCTVTDRGNVEDCAVTKGLPLLDASVLRAVTARRYEPALFEGRPVSVRMVIPVRFVSP